MICFVIAVLSTTSTFLGNLQKLGDQCGGLNYRGNTQCEPTLRCIVRSQLSSICLCPDGSWWCEGAPGYVTPSSAMPTAKTVYTTQPPVILLKLGDQCGGLNYRGNTQCEPTLRCIVRSEWTSTCLCPNGSWWCAGVPGYIK
ncbi:unnamed protein product [Adineta steineri]|uniref:CBM1 domain-containing protein n=1 Tax=Adineta steineri TaxID=433720 RepID=A0A819KSJ2_9BILA|nr:unnamed protein product [Adineta steineri]CAF3953878.1 unnamed protein product [Adineta steineri]